MDAVVKMLITDHLPYEFVENPGFRDFLRVLLSTPKKPPAGVNAQSSSEDNPFLQEEDSTMHLFLCKIMLEKMIIIDGLPFEFVEKQGFRQFIRYIRPEFEIPGPMIVSLDCLELYRVQKVLTKLIFSRNEQMVSLTTDTWTSNNHRVHYFCVTAHFIDNVWNLNKKILSFQSIDAQREYNMDTVLKKCLQEWGITNICSVTAGNMYPLNMSTWNGIPLLTEDRPLKCCVRVLKSIVSDGLIELNPSISRIRAACKYVRSSLSTMTCFKKCVNEANISYDQMVVFDVPTKWNSTYLMLEVAEKFEKAFNLLESEDGSYVTYLDDKGGPPNADDWNRTRAFNEVLKIFYEATLSWSGYLNVSSNCFLQKWVKINNALRSWIASDDFALKHMATNMKSKFDQYWDIDENNTNSLFFVAIFLDPRFKFEYVKFYLERTCSPEKCKDILEMCEDLVRKLFEKYSSWHPFIPDTCEFSGPSSEVTSQATVSTNVGVVIDIDKEYAIMVKKRLDEHKKSELERYMKDPLEVDYDGFDILRWWKGKSTKYYVLAHMARDILAIQVSSMSLEDEWEVT